MTIQDFWTWLARSKQATIGLDYDGTLAGFHPEPMQAVPYAGVTERLQRLVDHGHTTPVIITGRRTADIRQLLPVPLEVWGCHGLVRCSVDNQIGVAPGIPRTALEGIRAAYNWTQTSGLPRQCIEVKVEGDHLLGLAIHWRCLSNPVQATEVEGLAQRQLGTIAAQYQGLEVYVADMVAELRVTGLTKAAAVETLLRAVPGQPLAVLGDSTTDEDMFTAVTGHGIGILVHPTGRATVATYRLVPPQGVTNFLDTWIQVVRA